MGDVLKFKTEEERAAALGAVEEKPENLEKLDAIRAAEIDAGQSGQAEPEVKPPESQTPPPAAAAKEKRTFTISEDELPEGFDTPGKVFKSFKEGRDLIDRQTNFIKEKLQHVEEHRADPDAVARAERAEKALEELRAKPAQSQAQPAQSTVADIGTVQAEIKKIEEQQDELEKQIESDPDAAFTAEYQKKVSALSRSQTRNLNVLTSLYAQAKAEIAEARQVATRATEGVTKVGETLANVGRQDEAKAALDADFKEMDGLDDAEVKMSKPSREIESDYKRWRDDVSLAFYGRPAKNDAEKFAALAQLQMKNADLISKCQLMKVSVEPTKDIENYMAACELLNFRDGWRKDPATGKWEQLLRYDPATKTQVPLRMPSLKAALHQKRLEDGWYANKVDAAFQQGGESQAAAAMRRDRGAVEINAGSDQGQTVENDSWAMKILEAADEELVYREFKAGKPEKLEQLNKARAKFNMEPITFN